VVIGYHYSDLTHWVHPNQGEFSHLSPDKELDSNALLSLLFSLYLVIVIIKTLVKIKPVCDFKRARLPKSAYPLTYPV
jgi:hypothetical protein